MENEETLSIALSDSVDVYLERSKVAEEYVADLMKENTKESVLKAFHIGLSVHGNIEKIISEINDIYRDVIHRMWTCNYEESKKISDEADAKYKMKNETLSTLRKEWRLKYMVASVEYYKLTGAGFHDLNKLALATKQLYPEMPITIIDTSIPQDTVKIDYD